MAKSPLWWETITACHKVEGDEKDAATDFMFGDAPKYSGWKPGENGTEASLAAPKAL